MKTHLDLFSGIGGFALAASWAGFQTIGFCENEDFPRRLLSKRFPGVPIHGDIRELNGEQYRGVSLLTGGFPCQPFSVSGKQAGKADDRYLWPEMLRVIAQAEPDWVVAENVTGIVTMALDQVLSDLESEGYACGTVIVPACAVDAPHRRDRVWIVAHANELRLQKHDFCEAGISKQSSEDVANSDSAGLQGRQNARDISQSRAQRDEQSARRSKCADGQNWLPEPAVGRVVNGIPKRVDRLRGLGNAIVPQVAFEILRLLIEK